MTNLIILSFSAGVLGLFAGGLLGVFFGGKSVRSEALLLSFSGGAMLALVCFELLHEAAATGGAWLAAGAALIGAFAVAYLDYLIDNKTKHRNDFITCEDCELECEHDEKHEHCDHGEEGGHAQCSHEEHCHEEGFPAHSENAEEACEKACGDHGDKGRVHAHHHKKTSKLQLFVAGIVMALAIAIHNLPEGMSVGALYAEGGGRAGAAVMVLILSIVLHNIPEGMAITVPLITSGMKNYKAALIAALSGVPTVIGALIGYAIGDMGAAGLTLSLGFAAGSLLYVVFGEVLPQSINLYCSRKTAFAAIAGLVAGMLILQLHIH